MLRVRASGNGEMQQLFSLSATRTGRRATFWSSIPICLGATLLLVCGIGTQVVLAGPRSDAQARAAIFGQSGLADALGVRTRTLRLPAQERFDLLREVVLPDDGSTAIRIDIDFTPTYPPSPVERQLGVRGGMLVSPAIDLVETARELGRLDDLRQTLDHRSAGTQGATLDQMALRALITMSAGEYAQASTLVADFHRRVANRREWPSERPAEAVVAWSALRHPELRDVARDLVYLLFEQTRHGKGPRSERWHRQVHSLKHSLDPHVEKVKRGGEPDESVVLSRWIPVTRRTAETCGRGYPVSGWVGALGAARHVTSHDHDYIYYAVPLQGNFEVEADLTTFDYRDIHLAAGGVYAGPGYDLKSCLVGNSRRGFPSVPINPRLTRVFSWLRARIRVQDGVRTSYINGRKVYERAHGGDPWIGVHSAWYANGTVRNLRVSGDATIPEEIDLLSDPELSGWLPWFDESVGQADSDWRLVASALPGTEENGPRHVLIGRKQPELSDAAVESHLRYHRPVVEDAVIRYEFYYRPGECAVHPSLGRMVFLVEPEEIGLHWVTEGRHDRFGLDPLNMTIEPESRRGEGPLPLIVDDWNRMEVELDGATVRLRLNDQLVYERDLEPDADRTLGLFHYADRTEALVRHLNWRGDWMRALPEPHRQELADDSLEKLLATRNGLNDGFIHDFAEGLPQTKFHVIGGGWEDRIEQLPEGVRLLQPGGSYARTGFAPQVRVAGDFDIEVEFDQLETVVSPGGHANVQLLVELDDALQSKCRVYRKHFMRDDGVSEQLVQAAIFQTRDGETHYDFPQSPPGESSSGRLRISRRGRMVYFLCSDSSESRDWLVHSQEISADATLDAGVRLVTETDREGETSAVWKKLTIRAEEVTGLATEPMPTLAELDRQREQLTDVAEFDFREEVPLTQFQIWGTDGRFQRDAKGLRIEMPGFDQWTATGLAPRFRLDGDFDISLKMDVLELEAAARRGESTVYIETEIAGQRGTSVETKYAIDSTGRRDVEVQIRRREPNGQFDYHEVNRTQSDHIHELRLARRGDVAYFIFRDRPENQPIVLSRIRAGEGPIPDGFFRALVHTGGAGRKTVVRFRNLTVRSEQLSWTDSN